MSNQDDKQYFRSAYDSCREWLTRGQKIEFVYLDVKHDYAIYRITFGTDEFGCFLYFPITLDELDGMCYTKESAHRFADVFDAAVKANLVMQGCDHSNVRGDEFNKRYFEHRWPERAAEIRAQQAKRNK
jgi:hypothetical protein